MPVCHSNHNLHISFSFKCKDSVLNLFFIIFRIRISNLSDQISIYVQIIGRKHFHKTYGISLFLLRKHQCHPICPASKRRFIFIAQIHTTVFTYRNISAVVLSFMFFKFPGGQQQIRIIFPLSGKIMQRIILVHIKNTLYCLVTPGRILIISVIKQKEHTHGQDKHNYYKYQ